MLLKDYLFDKLQLLKRNVDPTKEYIDLTDFEILVKEVRWFSKYSNRNSIISLSGIDIEVIHTLVVSSTNVSRQLCAWSLSGCIGSNRYNKKKYSHHSIS